MCNGSCHPRATPRWVLDSTDRRRPGPHQVLDSSVMAGRKPDRADGTTRVMTGVSCLGLSINLVCQHSSTRSLFMSCWAQVLTARWPDIGASALDRDWRAREGRWCAGGRRCSRPDRGRLVSSLGNKLKIILYST
jgi:hypothetical protein